LADTREHGECLSSLLDEILAMLVELPAAVPVFLRYLANMLERDACLSPLLDEILAMLVELPGHCPWLGGHVGA